MSNPTIFIEEVTASHDVIVKRVELMKNHLTGADEDSLGVAENFMDVLQREIDRLEAEIADLDARIACEMATLGGGK